MIRSIFDTRRFYLTTGDKYVCELCGYKSKQSYWLYQLDCGGTDSMFICPKCHGDADLILPLDVNICSTYIEELDF